MSTTPAADRNLLFGILALQMDFIQRDALIKAMHAWVLDKTRPLGQILLSQGALAADAHTLLEALVEKHLQQHGGQPEKSLAALSSVGSTRKELEQIADPDVQASLVQVAAARAGDDFATRAPLAGEASSAGVRFRILRPHARGGLGEVFVAEDAELHREVALKEIQDRHADDPNSRARFVMEAEITGGLEHPGIVPVYGLGQYADGRPFYAMRFIRGDSLKDAIERYHAAPRHSVGERAVEFRKLLGRFLDVCNAMAYAHSRGVLHRDLKPGNIMLGKFGETLVVDWGLAKLADEKSEPQVSDEAPLQTSGQSGTAETVAGSALGTPQFMSPEQAAGRLDLLGPASDVYSLGATLYVLATGKPAFTDPDVGAVLQKVQRGEFPRPRSIHKDVPPALEAICLKAMALRPQDRYASPRALADDVERWLADEPVAAWPERWNQRLARWARHHRTFVRAAALMLVLATVGSAVAALWVNGERHRAEEARGNEKDAREKAEAARQAERDQRQAAEAALESARTALYINRIGQAERDWVVGDFPRAREALDSCAAARRGWEWNYLSRRCEGSLVTLAPQKNVTSLAVAYSPDGSKVATSHWKDIYIWNAVTGEKLQEITGEHSEAVYGLAFSPDGKRLVSGAWDKAVRVWEVDTRKKVWEEEKHSDYVYGVAFSPDGKWVASASRDGTARIWKADSGAVAQVLRGHDTWLMSVAFSPDSKQVATSGGARTIKTWDVLTGAEEQTLNGHTDAVLGVAFGPDGRQLASASRDNTVRVWNTDKGTIVATLRGHTNHVTKVAFHPEGRRLASASYDRTVRVWDLRTDQTAAVLRGHTNAVVGVAYSPSGRNLATCSFDYTAKIWDAMGDLSYGSLMGPDDTVMALAFHPDRQHVATVGDGGTVTVWDLAGREKKSAFEADKRWMQCLAYSPDGRRLATGSANLAKVWDADTGKEIAAFTGHSDIVKGVAFSPDSRYVASAGLDKMARVWDAQTGKEICQCRGHEQGLISVAYSPDGKWLVTGSTDQTARLWDAATGKELRSLRGHHGGVYGVAVSRDGRRIATGSWDHTVRIWDADTGRELHVLDQGQNSPVNGVAFSPDGKRLAAACDDRTVKVWDAEAGQLALTLHGAAAEVMCVAFSPDGAFLAAAGVKDKTIRLWNGAPFKAVHGY